MVGILITVGIILFGFLWWCLFAVASAADNRKDADGDDVQK